MPQSIPYIIPTIDPPKAMQRIDNVVAIPGVTTAVIRFTTPFATVPVVELSRADRIAEQVPNPTFVRFPIFDGLQQVHKVEFDGLEPFTHYEFVIKAAGGLDQALGLAKVTGDLFTATRSAHVFFDTLTILTRANEDMYFNIEVYDGGNDYGILSRFLTDHRFLDGGTYNQPFPTIDLDFAPDSLRFSILGYDEDSPSFPFLDGFEGFAHGPGPDTLLPDVPDGNTYADNDQAIITGIVQTHELGQFATQSAQTIDFNLNSINVRFGYGIHGRIIFQVTDHPETARRRRVADQLRAVIGSATSMTVGHAVAVGGTPGHAHMFSLGPDLTAYRKVIRSGLGQSNWQLVGEQLSGPLTVLGSASGSIDVFAGGEDGLLLHGRLEQPEKSDAKPVWQNLGEIRDHDVLAIRSRDGSAHLFGFDRSGAVCHLTLDPSGANAVRPSGWQTLGGSFTGSLSVTPQEDRFHVFVSDADRGVFYRQWTPLHPDLSNTDWVLLKGFKGPVSSKLGEDGSVFVVGFQSGNPSCFKVLGSPHGWGNDNWIAIPEPNTKTLVLPQLI
ncbi:MAG: hypothetical protein E8A46_24895 [Bradyrhizobium sp.]|uniref:hypothetical protein n=1 Tax=Bradyrhizobium sp. TaxID=376 RepID=UPI00120D751B|nr:hypothetical protein [Bradyrhizobium sp.]THD47118.1 MAG: hypothetical protein E8A46_24895 [Bradyrhizobium sp.]